ncbi:PRELI-like family protein [Onchocerca flexuosa]|uniref:PRELI-like family protein n=1 Tax=Onchocerca flexuosa TaxID=387005 RepID=A0A238BUI2_9BILA|nr:PRELI-like family protein [Onchocerca flexuosa]
MNHPWDTVTRAAWCKYPNPMNSNISGIDILRQHSLIDGSLRSERIIQSHFSIPTWATKLTGFSGTQYSYEVTEINPAKKKMTLITRNMNAGRFLRVDERLLYKPDPCNRDRTILQQEAAVSVDLPAFADYCEKMFLNIYETNARKGRKGLEWVIDQFNSSSRSVSNANKSSQGFSDPTFVLSSLHPAAEQPNFLS